jgi:hypothetical protein
MKITNKALNEILVLISVSNTANFLHSRLVEHPLVNYLAASYSDELLKENMEDLLNKFDGHITQAAKIYLLLFGLLKRGASIDGAIRNKLLQSRLLWIKDFLMLENSKNIPDNIQIFNLNLPTQNRVTQKNINEQILEMHA